MEGNRPFIVSDENFENHMPDGDCEGFPFEYSHTNLWNESFFNPEAASGFMLLHSDLEEIKGLLAEIKASIADIFEIKTDRE